MSKQDRTYSRTAEDIERKYNLGRIAQGGFGDSSEKLIQIEQELSEHKEVVNTKFEDIEETYMTNNNPVGMGSFSLNRKENTTVGSSSVAICDRTTASGKGALAEGCVTTASGNNSHAEGDGTVASGPGSHAEGGYEKNTYTTASGKYSHAEGVGTLSSQFGSHSEGRLTKAAGEASHSEGEGTIARGNCQHVQGKYNKEDVSNKYVHIVGWGTSDTDRKNIHTLDSEGNAMFAGDVSVTQENGDTVSFIETVLKFEEFHSSYTEATSMDIASLFI